MSEIKKRRVPYYLRRLFVLLLAITLTVAYMIPVQNVFANEDPAGPQIEDIIGDEGDDSQDTPQDSDGVDLPPEEDLLTPDDILETEEEDSPGLLMSSIGIAPFTLDFPPHTVCFFIAEYGADVFCEYTEEYVVSDGLSAEKPSPDPDPFSWGYSADVSFLGWYTVPYPKDGDLPYDFSPLYDDLSLYAVFDSPRIYKVTFDPDNGDPVITEDVVKGSGTTVGDILPAIDPTPPDGYQFYSWGPQGFEDWMIDNDMVFKAHYVRDTESPDSGLNYWSTHWEVMSEGGHGQTLSQVLNNSYALGGVYQLDSNSGRASIDFLYWNPHDMTLYFLIWTPWNNNSYPTSIGVQGSGNISLGSQYLHYSFAGGREGRHEVFAVYLPNGLPSSFVITVTYNSNPGGGNMMPVNINPDGVAPKYAVQYDNGGLGNWANSFYIRDAGNMTPPPPDNYMESVNPGYVFDYWEDNANPKNQYPTSADLPPTVQRNVVYKAIWKPADLIHVTFDKNTTDDVDGLIPESKDVVFKGAYGYLPGSIPGVRELIRVGYTFEGWYYDSACTDGPVYHLTTVVNPGNHSLYAKWTQDFSSIVVTKAVTGDLSRADFAEGAFKFELIDKDDNVVGTGSLPRDDGSGGLLWYFELDGLPVGEYTLTEDEDGAEVGGYTLVFSGGNSLYVIKDVVAERTVTNFYTLDVGSIVVTKDVTGDLNRDDFAEGAFEFEVIDKDDNVVGTGSLPRDDGSGNLLWYFDLYSLPVGDYTIIEDEDGAEVGGYTLVFTDGGTVTVTKDGFTEVTVTNDYTLDVGSIVVTKDVTGDLNRDDFGEGAFEFEVTDEDDNVVGTGSLPRDDGSGNLLWYFEIDGLPVGDYTVTEDEDGAEVDGYTLVVTGGGTVAVTKDDVTEVTVTNDYTLDVGSIVVTKDVTGDLGRSDFAEGAFEFEVTDEDDNVVGTGSLPRDDGAGNLLWYFELDGLPVGDYTVTEDEDGAEVDGYTLVVTGGGTVAVTKDGVTEVTVTNDYTLDVGSIVVTKDVTGDLGRADFAEGAFEFEVTDEDDNVVGTGSLPRDDGAGNLLWYFELDNLPVGDYTVTEDEDGAEVGGYTLVVTGGGTVAVTKDDVTEVTVTNAYTANTYTLSYNAGGGTGTMDDQTATYNQNLETTENAFSRYGYTFVDWLGSDGENYPNEYVFTPWLLLDDFTFTAQWTARTDLGYIVEYREGSAAGPELSAQKTVGGRTFGLTYTENAIAITGYTPDAATKSITIDVEGNRIVFIYAPNTYTLSYAAGGGSGTMASQTAIYGRNLTSTANTFSRASYAFSGWIGSNGVSYPNGYVFSPWRILENLVLTAQWTYVGGGGGGGDDPVIVPVITIPVVPPPADPIIIVPPPEPPATITPEPTPQAPPEEATIPPVRPPLVSYGVWALLNLILTIATGLIMVTLLVTYFIRRNDNKEDGTGNKNEKVERYLWIRLITISTTALSIVLFIFTQDMSQPIQLTDAWTIWHIVLLAATIVLAYLSREKHEEEKPAENIA